MMCITCAKDVNPFGELDPGEGMVQKCPHCLARLRGAGEPGLPVVPAGVRAAAAELRGARHEPPLAHLAPMAMDHATGLLEMARARLAQVDAELAKMSALTEEAEMLRRMIAAGEQPSPPKTLVN